MELPTLSRSAGWRRVYDDPPSSACTLVLPVVMTDGTNVWETTTSRVPAEDDLPLWWRIKEGVLNG